MTPGLKSAVEMQLHFTRREPVSEGQTEKQTGRQRQTDKKRKRDKQAGKARERHEIERHTLLVTELVGLGGSGHRNLEIIKKIFKTHSYQ